jgi:hypothetical protein
MESGVGAEVKEMPADAKPTPYELGAKQEDLPPAELDARPDR